MTEFSQPVYLDSSVALLAIKKTPVRTAVWDFLLPNSPNLISSRLLKTEVLRTLRRDALSLTQADELLPRVLLIPIDETIHRVAESFESHIKSLDAIHLATALLCGSGVTVASHDARMLTVAAELGIKTIDPVQEAMG